MNMIQSLENNIFCWINQHHSTFFDWFFWTFSQHWCWAIMLVLFFCFTTLRYEPKRWWLVLIGIALCFLFADRLSDMLKDVFTRLRPCHALDDVRMFRTDCGGAYGFPSSHAANVFALATFLCLRCHLAAIRYQRTTLSTRPKCSVHPSLFTFFVFLWAIIVGYSRIYLGKHYLGDVLGGMVLGMLCGLIIFFIIHLIDNLIINHSTQKKVSKK